MRDIGRVLVVCVLAAGVWPAAICGGDETAAASGFVTRTVHDETGEHRYALFVPREIPTDRPLPVIVYLHGAGERGTDGVLPTQTGPGPWLRERGDDFPALVVFPQCESTESRILTGWSAGSADARRVLAILEDVESEFPVDPQRRILTGWSMGGYGVWSLAAATPELWSALLPVSGGALDADVDSLADVHVWAIHGQRDNVVRPSSTRTAIARLQSAGGTPWLTVIPTAGHEVWRTVYRSPAVYEWMLAPSNEGSPPQLTDPNEAAPQTPPREFEPVLEISNAAEVRLGNRLFSGLSWAIPSRVPDEALSGSIADIHDSTSADGYWFRVTFARISYSAELERALVEATGEDRLELQFGLRNIRLTIGNTYVQGSGRAATAGPVTIAIGTRRPAWLRIVVEPYVRDRRLRFRLVSSSFQIEYDNWSVSPPWGVSTRGLGMTRRRVSDSIVQGLYSRKSRIEREVSAAVPSILSWVEDTLDISDAGQGVAAIWPLPVYRPEVRVWPESVATDASGASVRLGMAAAAPTPQPLQFRRVTANPRALESEPGDATLQLRVNAEALAPLSRLLVESRAARINVLDIPGEAFVPLVSREALRDAVPSLQDAAEDALIQTEFVLREPFALGNADEPGSSDGASSIALSVPRLTARISRRVSTAADAEWTTAAGFDCRIKQDIQASIEELRNASDLQLRPAGEVELQVLDGRQFAPDDRPATDGERAAFETLLRQAWSDWISGQALADTVIADLDFRKTRLRLTDMGFTPNAVVADFEIPPIAIHNLTEEPLEYELRGPTGEWSRTHTLEAGKSHQYDVDYSVTWQRRTADGTVRYTLKPGSHSEFRYPLVGGPPRLFSR